MPRGVDYGYFGDLTYNSVKRYQKANRLAQDGIVGNNTWSSMGLLVLSKGDAAKGVKVATIGFVQYLDVTTPVNSAFWNAGVEANKWYHRLDPIWFTSMVAEGRPWDVKRKGPWVATIGTSYPGSYNTPVILFGRFTTPEIIGNTLYGYTGTAAFFNEITLLTASVLVAGPGQITDRKNTLMK